jgi:ribosomal protein S18 acetylase RimI-like enzyme
MKKKPGPRPVSESALTSALAAFNARPASAADAAFLALLYRSTRPDLDSTTARPELVLSIMGMQQRLQGADYARRFPNAHYLILEHAGAAVARVVVDIDAERLHLVDIAVLPAVRGKGIGRAILTALQHYSANLQLPICLSVHLHNEAARRLYLALGFHTVGFGEAAERMRWMDQ